MNVSRHPNGFLVRVVRKGRLHQRWVKKKARRGHARAEQLAAALRRRHPAFAADRLWKKARSNTGHVGISRSSGRYQVRVVDLRTGLPLNLSFRFTRATRAEALARAIAARRAYERRAAAHVLH